MYHNNQRLRNHKVPVHHGDFFACYERSDSNTPFQADLPMTDIAQGWIANAPAPVHSEAAGSTMSAPSVPDAADNARHDGTPTFEQTGDPLLLIGRDSGRRSHGPCSILGFAVLSVGWRLVHLLHCAPSAKRICRTFPCASDISLFFV